MAPAYLKVAPNVGFNEIRYDVRKEYERLILYRAISPNGPWNLHNAELPRSGRYEDKAENDVTYYYRYLAINGQQHGSAVIDSVGVTPSADPFAPEADMLINNGAAQTDDLNVMLSFIPAGHGHEGEAGHSDEDRFSDIVEVKLSNESDLSKVEWQAFNKEMPWQLAPTDAGELAKVLRPIPRQSGQRIDQDHGHHPLRGRGCYARPGHGCH